MRLVDVMTPDPQTVRPGDTLQAAARLMDELNVGVLPVVDGAALIGVLTDRDIVVRSTSAGQDPGTATVADAMTTDARTLPQDASAEKTIETMEENQLRQVPVVDGSGRLVGIVSLGDLAAGMPEVATAFSRVDLPHPVGPMMAMNSWVPTTRFVASTAW